MNILLHQNASKTQCVKYGSIRQTYQLSHILPDSHKFWSLITHSRISSQVSRNFIIPTWSTLITREIYFIKQMVTNQCQIKSWRGVFDFVGDFSGLKMLNQLIIDTEKRLFPSIWQFPKPNISLIWHYHSKIPGRHYIHKNITQMNSQCWKV